MSMCMGHRPSDNRYCVLQSGHAGICQFSTDKAEAGE